MTEQDNNQEQLAPVLGFGVTLEGTDSLVGEVISLNLKRGPYFGIGDIALSPERYHATVSPGMNQEYYTVIRNGLTEGYIVRGKKRVAIFERRKGVLEAWYSMVKKEGRSPKAVDAFKTLIRKGRDEGYSLDEIARHCLKMENNGRNKQEVVHLLKQVLMYVERDTFYDAEVFEDEEGRVDVTLTKTEDGYVATDPSASAEPTPPNGHQGGSANASDVLDDVLEL